MWRCGQQIEGRISGLLSFLWQKVLWFEWELSSVGVMAIQCFSHLHCSNSSKKENLARSRRCVVYFLKLMMDQILKNNFPVIALSGRITLHCHTDNYQILWQVQTHCLVILAWKPSVHKNTTMENVQLAPGTCGRHQFESEWWDGWVGGGVPFFHKPNSDPQKWPVTLYTTAALQYMSKLRGLGSICWHECIDSRIAMLFDMPGQAWWHHFWALCFRYATRLHEWKHAQFREAKQTRNEMNWLCQGTCSTRDDNLKTL